MKDLGVNIDSELHFKDHIYDKINKAYQMLGIIKRNFCDLDTFSFLMLYKSMVRSHIEYANVVWSPYKDYLIEDIERVQKRATKLVKGLRLLSYKERLINLHLPTLKFRRLRGDMIEVYKILSGVYDVHVCPTLLRSEEVRTRGNCLKLKTNRTKYDIRKYSFCNRIVKVWNSLPDEIVAVDSVNCFKNKLDLYWSKEDIALPILQL
jgi:ribonuclease P/MRP protein subunit RPP40